MKGEPLLMLGLGCGFTLGLWAAIDFQNTQEMHMSQLRTEKQALQHQLKALKDDLSFLKSHQKELDFLVEKGWFLPKNRLIAGGVLEKLCGSLNDVQYTFEPEMLVEEHNFKVTKIVIKIGTFLDTDIYEFVESLLEKFPGILRPHEVNLEKGEHPNFVVGKLILEWIAMGGKAHED